jgi:aminoglycoside phosphotransferase family enzyme/predicted kinase
LKPALDLLPALIEALSRPEAYPHPVDAVEIHQTHISVVFLAGRFAYKIKKPVNLGFVDCGTLQKRKHFCEEEVRLNRRLAPQVYLGVIPITHLVSGGYRFGGPGVAVEWAVQMKRLPADATLESRLLRGEVTPAQVRVLADRVAEFHCGAESNERISSFGRFAVVAENARENFKQAEALVGATVAPAVFERVRALTETHLQRCRSLIEARAGRGVPRDTHGDLHLDHAYLFPDETAPDDLVIIDCIEFADRFRYADPVADMAFLAMDLAFHGRRDLAAIFADAYFAASGDADGRALLPFYSGYRAVVRAKVEGMELSEKEIDATERQDAEQRARAHWLLALVELEAPSRRPAVVLMGGLPGSGKSTLARSLAERANFTLLRSDVIRKELAGASAPNAGFNQGIYADAWSERTYAELLKRTEELLWQGQRVLIDANFRTDRQRQQLFDAAWRWGVPICFIHCKASPEVTRSRLQARRNDASDADWSVYQHLEQSWEPIVAARALGEGSGRPSLGARAPTCTHVLDTSGSIEQNKEGLQAILREEGLIS